MADYPVFERHLAGEHYARRRAAEVPETLYRYRAANTPYFLKELESFKNKNLYFPERKYLNDPQDCMPIFRRYFPLSEFKEYIIPVSEIEWIFQLKRRYQCSFDEAKKIFKKLHRREHARGMISLYHKDKRRYPIDGSFVGVLSLTARPDNNAMWSMYADRFKGYVQCFDVDKGKFDILGEPVKVQYRNEKIEIDYYGIYAFWVMGNSTPFGPYIKPRIHKRFLENKWQIEWMFTKSLEWSYEEEYRIISGFTSQYQNQHVLKPKSLILGYDMKSEEIESVEKYASVPIYLARPSSSSYGVDISPFKRGADTN